MKKENLYAEYPLSGQSVDQIAAQVEDFLTALRTERSNVLRIRLSPEEALLRWLDRFGEDAHIKLELILEADRQDLLNKEVLRG